MILIKKVSMMTFDFAELVSILPDAWTCWSEEKQESGKWGGEAAAAVIQVKDDENELLGWLSVVLVGGHVW